MIALVCVLKQMPNQDPANCTEKNAIHVLHEHRDFSSTHSCYIYAHYKTMPLLDPEQETFSKIKCAPGRET